MTMFWLLVAVTLFGMGGVIWYGPARNAFDGLAEDLEYIQAQTEARELSDLLRLADAGLLDTFGDIADLDYFDAEAWA